MIRLPLLVTSLAVSLAGFNSAKGQASENPDARTTRAQIEQAIGEAEKIANSPGYSGRIKQAKRMEITLLRGRLTEGDLQPGDLIILSVQGEKDLSDTFVVGARRFITLPGIADVSLYGVLRSEVEDHLSAELRKYLKDPIVHLRTTIRLSVLGLVAKPGFFQVPSETMIGDAIMTAGGPANGVDPAKTRVERAGVEILSREAFAQALTEGRTLDQLNLQAGDEILVGGARTPPTGRNWPLTVGLPALTGVVTLSYFLFQIFR